MQSQLNPEKPDTVSLVIDARGDVFWNNDPVSDDELAARLTAAAGKKVPQSELHVRADRGTRYEKGARVMADSQNAGVQKIGFATDPSLFKADSE